MPVNELYSELRDRSLFILGGGGGGGRGVGRFWLRPEKIDLMPS